ncbi:MAG: AMP-binding protein, partial [Chloroflexi bacterium]|nr:AMP-binding protein [Chloroflexota bacterium]
QPNLQPPISNLQSRISNPQSPISNLQSPISNLQSPPTFSQVLRQTYTECPERVAVYLMQNRQDDRAITYGELLSGAAGYADALAQAGVKPGDVVIVILQHGADLLMAFWGAVLHGAVPSIMPFLTEKLAPERYRQDLAALIQTTRPTAIITYAEFTAEIDGAISNLHAARPISAPHVLISSDVRPAEPDFEHLGGIRRSPDDIVLLQHSSGTTGLQKGVALSHRAVFNQLERYAQAIHLTQEDVIVSWLPLYHDMGLIASFIMPILRRVPLVLMSPFDWVRAPYKLFQAVTRYRGTLTWLPNFAYNFCAQKIRERDLAGVDLSSLRAVINCSEPTYWSSHQAFLNRYRTYGLRAEALATSYAMAENVFAVTQAGIDAPVTVDEVDQRALLVERVARSASGGLRLLSAGRPLPNVQVRVLEDATNGGSVALRRDLPERYVGEIALRSDCMLSGYYNRPDLTGVAFMDGWYLTGDLGYLAAGELYVTGRKKDLIIVGGKNVYPQDLERLASEAPGVHPGRVVAFGVVNPDAGTEDVVMVAEVDATDPDERQRIGDAIRQHVTRSSDVALRQVRIVEPRWLLKTSSGKTARAANRDKYLAEVAAGE